MSTFASPADTEAFGEYSRPESAPGREPFLGLLGSEEFPLEPGRYHLYAGWFCPWAQRVSLSVELDHLKDFVSVSYVDNERDARGWAFREDTGPDPVNGFSLLSQAYEAARPGYDGHVSVPLLWDKVAGTVVTNDPATLARSFPAAFDGVAGTLGATPAEGSAPPELREAIADVERWLRLENTGPAEWDARLGDADFLVGDALTQADVYLWVKLVRSQLDDAAFPRLAAYRDRLWALPAFQATTDASAF